ncbi:MAG: MFS transporter [Candidatus Bathyarchaeia archaeon]
MKPFWMVCVTHMFVEVYFLTQVALIPVFMREFSLTLIESSLVATVPSLVQLLANLPSGFMAERFSTRQLLFTSMVTEGLSALLVSQTDNFWMLVLGVSAMRLCSPIYHISGLSRISHLVERDRMNRSMGFHNALGSFGSAIGLVVLSVFLSTVGWRWIYVFWAMPILIWAFIVSRSSQLATKATANGKAERGIGLDRLPIVLSTSFLILLAAIGFRGIGHTGSLTYMTTYLVEARDFTESAASLIFGLGTFMSIAGSLNGGYLGEKIGAKKALSLAILGSIISLSVLGLMAQVYLLMLVYLIYAFFSSSVWSPINALVAHITPGTGRGLSFSIYFLTEGLVVSITPTLAAAVIGSLEIWYIFPFSIIFLTIGLMVLQLLHYSG